MNSFQALYTIRAVEMCIQEHYHEDQMKTPMHMSMGQEHIPVGVLSAVGDRAMTFCSYRSHAPYLARTNDVEGFFKEMYGLWSHSGSPNGGRAGSMHISNSALGHYLSSGIVASQIPIAVGAAHAAKMAGNGKISVVFFGDGATNEGIFWESINLACLMQLPIIFVCSDNFYAVHAHRDERNGYGSLSEVLRGFYLSYIPGEDTNVDTVIHESARAVDAALSGVPAFIHWDCWRYLEHVGVRGDYDAGYRKSLAYDYWNNIDPIRMEYEKLLRHGYVPQRLDTAMEIIDIRVRAAALAAKEEHEGMST